jgi:hypothetical protein
LRALRRRSTILSSLRLWLVASLFLLIVALVGVARPFLAAFSVVLMTHFILQKLVVERETSLSFFRELIECKQTD